MARRKYWDEEYVKSLENQVQALLALQSAENTKNKGVSDISGLGLDDLSLQKSSGQDHECREIQQDDSESTQSRKAMEELSVMMWRTNLADGVTIVPEPGNNQSETTSLPKSCYAIPNHILDYAKDRNRIRRLATLFLENINREHQFTEYETTIAFSISPDHPLDVLFLHGAVLAAGATFENQSDSLKVSDDFAELSESLVFTCFRNAPTIKIIQGLCILSWRSLALGHDHLGWTFLSMAAGMAVHLRLHVLALDEIATNSIKPPLETVQTFWSFYMTDRTSVSILGRNCILPWRRVNVPAIESFFRGEKDLAKVSFAWQCKLWYMHDQNMDRIFSSSFEQLDFAEQIHLLILTHKDLSKFFKSLDQALEITRKVPPKPVLLFHMSYQMAILVTMPPFLRVFATVKAAQPNTSKATPLVLRSITSAAASMVRLVQTYTKNYGFEHANPLLIHHILSASIVHLMNTTTTSHTFRRYNTRSVRTCLNLLRELGRYWKLRSKKSLDVIEALARRWNVEFVLCDNDLKDDNTNINLGASPEKADPFAPISHLMPDSEINTEDAAFNVRNGLFDEPPDLHIGMADDWQRFEWSTEPQLDFLSISFPEGENEALGLSQIFRFGSSDDLSLGFTR
ncbi:hypothetical protein N7520_005422 [Penicillium odoratum]|uniref:uncharacterized protein n=1 Tax=Penicillium odoratum TaxID=1167516 RepID=UPI002547C4B9|nr:uncharacterized protein N7520_005422 [Penicillium odoratum]KAJ5765863.1 hypothetical protein N7520_005422 [Penicillium odoratum]